MKRGLVFACLVLAAAFLSPVVHAQESKMSGASYGLFTNDVDNYMDVNYWEDVEFEKFFSFVSGGQRLTEAVHAPTGGFAGGIATTLKGLYLGFFVDGQFWDGTAIDRYKDNKRIDDMTSTNPPDDEPVQLDHQWALLLGGGFGGIKAWVDFNNTSHDYDKNTDDKKTATADAGYLSVGAEYGKNLEGKGGTWNIFAGLNYDIALNGSVTTVDGKKTTTVDGMDALSIYGGTSFPVKTGWAGAEVALSIGIQRSPYKDKDTELKWKGYDITFVKSGYIGRDFEITEQLTLAMEFDLDSGFSFCGDKWEGEDDNGQTVPTGSRPDTISLFISPQAEVALQYRFQKPFMLIAGLQYARIPKLGDDEPFYSLTTEYDEAANTVTQQFRPLELALSLGGAWTPAPQFTLESKLEALPFGRLDFKNISANFEHIPFEISLLASLKF